MFHTKTYNITKHFVGKQVQWHPVIELLVWTLLEAPLNLSEVNPIFYKCIYNQVQRYHIIALKFE